ncbi:MAG: preprotein translocase subunit SecG [Parachlamydiales bacterium]|jgi:preprotein translocase subunit SecG
MSFVFYFFLTLFILLCFLLSFVILIQDSKTMGLGASFGGDSSDSLFGTSTADVVKKFTTYLTVIFLVSCVALSLWTNMIGHRRSPVLPQMEERQE